MSSSPLGERESLFSRLLLSIPSDAREKDYEPSCNHMPPAIELWEASSPFCDDEVRLPLTFSPFFSGKPSSRS